MNKILVFYSIYAAAVLITMVAIDRKGWVLHGLGNGGMGRSYSAYNHK